MGGYRDGQGRGSRGARGAIAPPPHFLSQGDGYACAPPPLNFGNHYRHINIFAPPQEKSFPNPWGRGAWEWEGVGVYGRVG